MMFLLSFQTDTSHSYTRVQYPQCDGLDLLPPDYYISGVGTGWHLGATPWYLLEGRGKGFELHWNGDRR